MNLENTRELKRRLLGLAALEFDDEDCPIAAGIGLTDTAHDYRLSVRLKRTSQRKFLEDSRISAFIEKLGSEIKVKVMGAFKTRKRAARKLTKPSTLTIGTSVGHESASGGTLGFFAERNSDKKRGIVSCNHVLALVDAGKGGDDIICPSVDDGGTKQNDAFADLDGSYPPLLNGGRKQVDSAFAVFQSTPAYEPAQLDGGDLVLDPAVIVERLEVSKIGAETRLTHGIVTDIEYDCLEIEYGEPLVYFDDVIVVESFSSQKFSDHRDSGALVYTTDTFQPVGLFFAGTDLGEAYINPIGLVQSKLGVTLIVSK